MNSIYTSNVIAMLKASECHYANDKVKKKSYIYIIKHLFLLSLSLPYIQVDYREGLFYSIIMPIESLLREPTDVTYVIMMLEFLDYDWT